MRFEWDRRKRQINLEKHGFDFRRAGEVLAGNTYTKVSVRADERRWVTVGLLEGTLVAISAADPLNLTGIVTAGERIRTAGRNRIVYRDGVPLAVAELGRGQLSGDHLTVLLLFVVSALGSVRAGQRWADAVRARRANAS